MPSRQDGLLTQPGEDLDRVSLSSTLDELQEVIDHVEDSRTSNANRVELKKYNQSLLRDMNPCVIRLELHPVVRGKLTFSASKHGAGRRAMLVSRLSDGCCLPLCKLGQSN
jgi:hypothetical protein